MPIELGNFHPCYSIVSKMHVVLPQAGRHLCSLDRFTSHSHRAPTCLQSAVPFRWPTNQSSPQPVAVELVMFPCTLNLPIRERHVEIPVSFGKIPGKDQCRNNQIQRKRTTHAIGCPIRENAPRGSASALLIHKCLPVPSHLCSQPPPIVPHLLRF